MNRAERRELLRDMRKDPLAKRCTVCGKKTRHIAVPTSNNLCNIVCEYCGAVLIRDSNTAIPMTYV